MSACRLLNYDVLRHWTPAARLTMLFHRPLASSSCPFMVKWKQSWVKKVISIFPFCSETQNIHSWPSVISAKPQAVAVAPGSSVSHSSRRDASQRFICWHDTVATLRTGRRGGSACFRKGWSTTAKSSLKKRLLFRSSSSRLYQQEKNNSSAHLSVG